MQQSSVCQLYRERHLFDTVNEPRFYLLHDTVHLFKSIRNNWITEKSERLKLVWNNEEIIGKWSDVIAIYDAGKHNTLQRTRLSYSAVYPKTSNVRKSF